MTKALRRTLAGFAAAASVSGAAYADTMPQLQFSNPLLWSQIVWGAVIFLVFYLVLSRSALKRVGAILEHRGASIAADLDRARQAKEDADRAAAELAHARRQASAEAQQAVARALETAKQEAAAQVIETNARLGRQIAESEQRIAAAHREAMGSLKDVATDTAEALVQRLTGRAPERARLETAVARALSASGLAA